VARFEPTDLDDIRRAEQAFRDRFADLAIRAPMPDVDRMLLTVTRDAGFANDVPAPAPAQPPSGVPAPPAPAAAHPSHWKRWTLISVAAAAILALVLIVPFAIGVVQFTTPAVPAALATPATTPTPTHTPSATPTPPPAVPALTAEQRDGLIPPAGFLGPYEGGPDVSSARVFDFAEVAEVVPYCDLCSVNDLATDFGALTSATGSWDEVNATVTAVFGTTTIKLSASGKHMSFETRTPGTEYPLTADDKDVALTLVSTSFSDPTTARLPRGLKIGESTAEDARRAYPDASWYRSASTDFYSTSYAYIWFDNRREGFAQDAYYGLTDVTYIFDTATDRDILTAVRIRWNIQMD